jgi:superfamily II DNA or RNA helicase
LIINDILTEQDRNAILTGKSVEEIPFFDISNIENLKNTLSERDIHFFNCLAWLIRNDRLEIKIISPKDSIGISHTKSGVFFDGINIVAFDGSCNFSRTALVDNIESLTVSCSWDGDIEKAKIDNLKDDFESVFQGQNENVIYVEAENVKTRLTNTFEDKLLSDLLNDEYRVLQNDLSDKSLPETIIKVLDKAKSRVEVAIEKLRKRKNEAITDSTFSNKPSFPYETGPRDYQQTAFENWKNNKQQGLFAMATGTGKTITSLNCLLEIYKKVGYYKALILVPTITLVNQWESECRKFNFANIIKVCSKSASWKNDIAGILLQERLRPTEQISYIVIATYASFSRQNIFAELNQLSAKTLLIADECHNMGSATMLKILPKVNWKRRIGLSATPERQYDEESNLKLFSFFNSGNGYTYEYSMQEAINKGVLCRYYYYPHLVSLTDSEMQEYMKLSEKISKYYNSNSDSFKNDPILTALLLARKRIIHKAFNKVSVFNDILQEHYNRKHNLKYTLVYVPEGNDTNDYFESDFYSENDETETDNDAIHLIDVFTKAVRDIDNRTTVRKFVSGIAERDKILEQFAKGEIDVLTSMKCLDEGVDVPRAELAIFCASTGNPRQFVQRRGRILRQHPDKQFAYIHDLVVIPEVNPNSDSYTMERSILKKELERVNNFALLSENSSYTLDVLLDTMNFYNLNLYSND